MSLVALKCPNCGGSLDLEDSRQFAFCQYCGTKIMIKEEVEKQNVVIDDSKKVAGWIDTAKMFIERGNKEECYRYARMASDADPNNPYAWYYRAKSAPNIDEEMICSTRALELLPETDELYPEAKHINEGTKNKVIITLIRKNKTYSYTSYELVTFFDGERVVYDSSESAKFVVSKGSTHVIKVNVNVLVGSSFSFTPMQDRTYTISSGTWGVKIKQFK